MNNNPHLQRVDIQALRGLAVMMVVLYHSKIGNVTGGYLGVDIFFVISGYLITRLVASGISRGDFSLKAFYLRRARRLLPAAFATFTLTAAFAPWFLNQMELRDFAAQLIGALTFTGNFVLWQQTGYFEGSSDLKPLLHIWSLALEEQYYFLLPAILLLSKPSRWLTGTIALVCISLGLCIIGGILKPIATFYLLPTRAWELLIGSAGALWALRENTQGKQTVADGCQWLFIPSLLCLLLLPFFPFDGTHPGLNALLVCSATVVVLLRNSPAANSALPTILFSKIGDFSYSLYLVHWPIIAFMKNSWVGSGPGVPLHLRILTLVGSFIAAYLLYKTIEEPMRRQVQFLPTLSMAKVAFGSILLASITPAVIYAMPSPIDFKEVRKANYGLAEVCDYKSSFVSRPECRTNDNPGLLVWGDSFAMHLIPGLTRSWKAGGIVQATRSQCGPFLGLAPKNMSKPEIGMYKNQAWAENCIKFNQSVIDFLRNTPSIKTVVLSSPFSQYVTNDNLEHVIQKDHLFFTSPANTTDAPVSLHRTVSEIRALGKKVVLIAPPPSSDFDVGACLERQLSAAVAFGGRPGCLISRVEYQEKRAAVLTFLKNASADENVAVISFDPFLCGPISCKTLIDGTMLYRDSGHLSIAGSKLLFERMQLADLIVQQAK
jgi:peptidoglycan/LPS O-acetylase OafA/YrhL